MFWVSMLLMIPFGFACIVFGCWWDRNYVGCPLPRAVKAIIMPEFETPPGSRRREPEI